jgi:tetratricopeptide (TPR) repeat protein
MSQPEHRDDFAPEDAFVQLLQAHEEAVRAGRMSEANDIAGNFMALVAQRAMEEPSPELLLQMEAQRCEEAADWPGAEVAYRRVLDRAVATGEVANQYKSFSDLSNLYELVGNETAALELARSATEAARRTDISILLAMALEQQAGCALRLDLVSEALTALDEALRSMGRERMYDVERGRCLVLRAECRLRSGDTHSANRDLEAARQDLEAESAMKLAAGVHSALARWWSVKARLLAGQGDWSEAAQAWTKAVAGRRHVAELPQVMGAYTQNALAETLWAQGQALLSAGCPREAEESLTESQAIRERIGLPHLL